MLLTSRSGRLASMAGHKIFVGSLPDGIDDGTLRTEFSKYGQVADVFIKPGCESGRQWAFVTLATQEQAKYAKDMCDRVLLLPGAVKPCDVMLAKNQGMFGQDPLGSGGPQATSAPRKIFVGSLPDGIQEASLRAEYSRYGTIEEVFLKQGCESGRQWAFVTFQTPEEAANATAMTNNVLQFQGAMKACEVTLARNQGLFGQSPIAPGPATSQASYAGVSQPGMAGGGFVVPPPAQATQSVAGPTKIFVGSLPDWITEEHLRAEFSRFGQIHDVFVKTGCESGRQWAFVTYGTTQEAQLAKDSTDRALVFPGCEKACEVTLARNQGLFGQSGAQAAPPQQAAPHVMGYPSQPFAQAVPAAGGAGGPRKIFVGSLPDGITENDLRAQFSRYGHVVDCFLKMGSHSGRHWSFITFATGEEASNAKMSTDRVLTFPGSLQPCEVIFAKNQGLFGQQTDPSPGLPAAGGYHAAAADVGGYGAAAGACYGAAGDAYGAAQAPQMQTGVVVAPPPPSSPPPSHLTPWREYKTVAGLPYYHNSKTGVTTWECPPDLMAQPSLQHDASGARYAPY